MIELNGEKAYTTKEVGEILFKTEHVIRQYIRDGKLRATEIARRKFIPESSLSEYAQRTKTAFK